FKTLVQKYSDDQFSIENDGQLAPFGVGEMVPEFENAAFALKKPGDISPPVKTEFGYHIIRLEKKIPIQPYDSVVDELSKKVESDGRALVARKAFFDKIKNENGFKEFKSNYDEVENKLANLPVTGDSANKFRGQDFAYMNKPVFQLGGKDYLQSDFIAFADLMTRGVLSGPRRSIVKGAYDIYVERVVTDFKEHQLEDEFPEFKSLMKDYKEGITLFELMDRKIWSAASKDSVGLEKFYETQKTKYQFEPGFRGAVYSFQTEDALKEGEKLLKAGKGYEEIAKTMNNTSTPSAVTINQ